MFYSVKKVLKLINDVRYIKGSVGQGSRILTKSFVSKDSVVGRYTFINEGCTLTKATVGNYCSIGADVIIGPGEHELNRASLSGVFYSDNYETLTAKEVSIGHDVWIGTRSIILRGVEVGNGAVIGAGSVVTKDVPEYTIVAGSPARVIRSRFSDGAIKLIRGSLFYDLGLERARAVVRALDSSI